VVEKLELLGRHTPFTLAFTILRTNAAEVRACAELAERVGAAAAVFRPLYPVGTAVQHLDALMPAFDQYHDGQDWRTPTIGRRLSRVERARPDEPR
jgi:MoaA/NifB/PqqE/SkfB family radical SAM enzyme